MLRRGQIAVAAVGEFDGEGVCKGAAGFDVETDLREDLEGDRCDAEVADAERLDGGLNGIGLRIACGERALSVGLLQTMSGRRISGFGEHALSPCDHFRRGTTHGELQIARGCFQRHPVLMLQRFANTQHFLREVAGDKFNLFVGLAFHGGSFAAVVIIVHVATGAVGQNADTGCSDLFFDATAKFAEVICG